jgi:hypothetical protein
MVLAGATAIAGGTLAGCATGTPTTGAAWVTALESIASEIALAVPQLVEAGLGGNTLTSVQEVVAEIQQALSGVGAAITATAGQDVLVQVEGYINAIAPLVQPFLSLIPGGSIIGLIVAALPAIEALLNVAVTALTSVAQSLASSAPAVAASGKLRGTPSAALSQQYLILLEQRARVGGKLRR